MDVKQSLHRIYEIFSALLNYPEPDLLERAQEGLVLLAPVNPEAAFRLEEFCAFAEKTSPGKMEEVYTHTFDLQMVCSPYAGYHLFGESHKRGVFMAKLNEHYRSHGFSAGNELADHISVILRFLAAQEDLHLREALLGESLIPVLKKMAQSLTENNNPYGKVIESLLLVLEPSSAISLRSASSAHPSLREERKGIRNAI